MIARKRNAGSLPAGSATALIDWIRKQNINVGGWKLKKISCNVQENNRVVCSSDYQRGPLTLATNESFLQNSPVPKENVSFDISGVQIHTAIAIPFFSFIDCPPTTGSKKGMSLSYRLHKRGSLTQRVQAPIGFEKMKIE